MFEIPYCQLKGTNDIRGEQEDDLAIHTVTNLSDTETVWQVGRTPPGTAISPPPTMKAGPQPCLTTYLT